MKKLLMFCAFVALIFLIAFGQKNYAVYANTNSNNGAFSIIYPEGHEISDGYKVVYLTFDDGPAKYTPEILEILTEYDVPGTFFVVGNTPYTYYISDIVENSHAIGLHSYSHDFGQIYSSVESFFDDLQKIDDIVYDLVGIRSKIIRFPGGSRQGRVAQKTLWSS